MSTSDKKQVARNITLSDPECHVRETDLVEKLEISQNRISEIVGNTNIGNIDTLLS